MISVSVLRVSTHAWIPDKEYFPDLSSNMQGPIAPAITLAMAVKRKPCALGMLYISRTVEAAGE